MSVVDRIRQARWFMWILVPMAIWGAYSLIGEAVLLEIQWDSYQKARKIAIARDLVIPGFREYRRERNLELDPLFGQISAQAMRKAGGRAIKELLPLEEQTRALETLIKFQASSRLMGEGDEMLAAERIDEIHLILHDPKHRSPDELRAWLSRVDDQADRLKTLQDAWNGTSAH